MGLLVALTGLLGLTAYTGRNGECKHAPVYVPFPQKGSISNSQNLDGPAFIGSPTKNKFLKSQFPIYPKASLMHGDGGNTGNTDYPGPLGVNTTLTSGANTINIMMWGADGSLTAGYANASVGLPPPRGLVAVDPATYQINAAWYPPDNETLGLAYMEYMQDTNDILLSTKEGNVYVVHRGICKGHPFFRITRNINLKSVIKPWELLLNTMYDAAGNIWFTTGGIIGGGDPPQNSSTFGYIKPDGTVIKRLVKNQMVENGIAVSGMDVYMATGPSGEADTSTSTGYMWAMDATGSTGLNVKWKVPYDSGAGGKPGEIARGTGATPVLLDDKFVVITDNADPKVNLLVYHQKTQESAEEQLVCSVPLFEAGKSNNDNAALAHFDGENFGVMIQNNYGAPPVRLSSPGVPFVLNGPWNDMSGMAGGMVRVDVTPKGECSVRWNSDLAVKAVSILSTKSGLLYSSVQDTERAAKGEYVWYLAAVDWLTGKTTYQYRTGMGGTFNDNWSEGTLGPDGTFYQSVLAGVIGVKDKK
ncbi:hypothetical protein FMEXI_13339 [Fusarium mexicanum]|uniref:Trichothecene biosynthesis protein n=1 Tax=Fusarium mexicanum TaxID=751941 RepID=A0A8H5MK26_9HYPO|nr:hypothetical protein FMEXI_13339 [Fusarium mexicanum]